MTNSYLDPDNYNPEERLAPPEEDDVRLVGIEVGFAIETWVSPSQQRRLSELLREIVDNPKNTPKEGVHWLGFTGGKMNFSEVDCKLLGTKPGPNPPADGEEPQCDDSILCFGSMSRGFVSERERADALEERRPSEFTCPQCGGHAFGSNRLEDGKLERYCNGRGQRVRFIDGRSVPIEGPDEPSIRCDFKWHEDDDRKYGLKPPSSK